MIVSEADLAPYRDDKGQISLKFGGNWFRSAKHPPHEIFTSSERLFPNDWHEGGHRPKSNSFDEIRKTLQVVPFLAFTDKVPILCDERQWVALDHQCGGYSCSGTTLIGTRLTLRTSIVPGLNAIAREGLAADHGHFYTPVRASRIVWYVNALRRLNLDCEASWVHLIEGVYPIDYTKENMAVLMADVPDLAYIADWTRSAMSPHRTCPTILLLAKNSD